MKFVIEHLEKGLPRWCLIEYKYISKNVGKGNLIFTNTGFKVLTKYGKVLSFSVKKLDSKNACLLDPEAKETLTPSKAKRFEYFIFGGILGNYPPEKRTDKYFKDYKIKRFNLGKKQMSTDTAVLVTKMIRDGTKLKNIKFKDHIEIGLDDILSIQLPYRYIIKNNKPLISEELIEYLKKRDEI